MGWQGGGGLTGAVVAEDERPTAALVPAGSPSRVDGALPVGQNADSGILVGGWSGGRETEALYVTSREADSEERFRRVQSLGEELRAQRQRTQILEHR